MHRFAHAIVAAEAETDIAHAARGLRARAFFLDTANGINEVDGIVGYAPRFPWQP